MADAHVALRTLMLCVRCFYLFIICWTPGPRVLFVKGISPASETSKDTSELFHVPPQLLRNGSRRRLSICFSASCWWLSPTFPWCSLLMSWPRLEHSFHFSTKISSERASERARARVCTRAVFIVYREVRTRSVRLLDCFFCPSALLASWKSLRIAQLSVLPQRFISLTLLFLFLFFPFYLFCTSKKSDVMIV